MDPVGGSAFIGGMNVPGKHFGRLNATRPLVRLTCGDARIELRLRGALSRFAVARAARYEEIEAAQEVRGAFGSPGVRLRVRNRGTWYFWTPSPPVVLAVMSERGVPVLEGCPRLPFLYSDAWA